MNTLKILKLKNAHNIIEKLKYRKKNLSYKDNVFNFNCYKVHSFSLSYQNNNTKLAQGN